MKALTDSEYVTSLAHIYLTYCNFDDAENCAVLVTLIVKATNLALINISD